MRKMYKSWITAQSWLNLQACYDLKVVSREVGEIIANEVRPRAA